MPRDTRQATQAHMRSSAVRAAEDPAKLSRALRIVTAAADRGLVDSAYIASIVERAPALTDAQVERLRAVLPAGPAPAEESVA